MGTVIVGALLGLLGTVIVRFFDLFVEGRGAVARRAISANVELLKALPKEVRNGAGAQALALRIDAGLIEFAAEPVEGDLATDATDATRLRAFRDELEVLETKIAKAAAFGAFLLAAYVAMAGHAEVERLNSSEVWTSLVQGGALGAVVVIVVRWATVHAVRRRWRKRGWRLPSKYA